MKNLAILSLTNLASLCLIILVISCTSFKTVSTARLSENLSKIPGSVSTGNVVRIKLKNETIEKLKVTAIDSDRIAGVQSIVIDGHRVQQTRIIKHTDIETMQKQRPIVSGNIVNVTMKDGTSIKKMKVKEINSEEITGTQISLGSKGEWVYLPKALMITDIKEIKKRRFSPLKTLVLVVSVVSIPTILIILFPPQFQFQLIM